MGVGVVAVGGRARRLMVDVHREKLNSYVKDEKSGNCLLAMWLLFGF